MGGLLKRLSDAGGVSGSGGPSELLHWAGPRPGENDRDGAHFAHDHQGGNGRGASSLENALRRLQPLLIERHGYLISQARQHRAQREQLRSLILQLLISHNVGHARLSREALADELTSAMVGYGILEPLMEDPSITEIMVNGPHRVFVERGGRLESVDISFRDESQLSDLISRMVAPLGRRIDASCPYVDGRLPDGSRINAIIPPLSLCGPVLTIRKFSSRALSLSDLVGLGSLNEEMADFLALAIRGRLNVLISGGAGSGKTTTLNALVSSLPASERILTIEDAAELHLDLPHVVSLECRPANAEGRGEVTIRQLLRNALRMRPDRIVVGECRGEEAVDMLQAMNTGHPGSACTVHANSAPDALTRLENMVSMGDATLPLSAIRAQVRSALDVVIHQVRFPDGSRKIAEVALVRDDDPPLRLLFRYCGGSDGGFRRLAGVPLTPLQQEKLLREGLTVPAWLREEEGPV